MSLEEVRTRIAQEAGKRFDLTLYRWGKLDRPQSSLQPASRAGRFFFSLDDVRERARLVRETLPIEADAVIHEADAICRHQFHLLGYKNLEYGAEIDWHLDAVHRRRAPLKPWFKIDFLNCSEVGDHKITWELNRHQHLVTLAKAWCLTEDSRYSTEVIQQWYAWQTANPYPMGINWASALEVAFRSLSWLWVRNLLAANRGVPSSFDHDLVAALRVHGRYIERYRSTYFSPNTHLIGEAVALFFIGALCPEISQSQHWQQLGWRIVTQEAERQVRADGVYFEQSVYYHVYALDFFLHARILAALNNTPIPQAFDTILHKMLEFLEAAAYASVPEGFGDDDGGRVFNPRRNRVEHMLDPLSIGAVLYDRPLPSRKWTEEVIWLFGEKAIRESNAETSQMSQKARQFAASGIHLIYDDDPCAQQMMIDAGPQGTGRSGHGHADALSIRFSLDQQRCLIDSGTYSYMSSAERNFFRGTGAHNTMRVDGLDQAVPEGPFAWSSLPNVSTEAWVCGNNFELFLGYHDGYRRLLDPVTHRRLILHVHGGFWFIHDHAEGRLDHELEVAWHFSSDMNVSQREGTFLVSPAQTVPGNGIPSATMLTLLPVQNGVWSSRLESEPISPAYGTQVMAPVVRFLCKDRLPTKCATFMVAQQQNKAPGRAEECSKEWRTIGASACVYRYQEQNRAHYVVLAEDLQATWSVGPLTSDAKFVYFSIEDAKLADLVLWKGSMLQLGEKKLLDHSRQLEWFEVSKGRAVPQVFSSAPEAASAFDVSILTSEIFPDEVARISKS
jgi:hypothetical protein